MFTFLYLSICYKLYNYIKKFKQKDLHFFRSESCFGGSGRFNLKVGEM